MPNTLRTDFHDDAFWKPRLTTDKAGRLTFEVTYPDDITSWDANFIVVGGRRQTDRKQLRIKSYKPLNAQLSVPRFAIAGDSLNAAGRLTNHTGDTLSVRRTIETDGRTAEKQIRIATSHTDAIPAVAVSASFSALCRASSSSVGYVYSLMGAPNTSANCAQSATSLRLYITQIAAFTSSPGSSGDK